MAGAGGRSCCTAGPICRLWTKSRNCMGIGEVNRQALFGRVADRPVEVGPGLLVPTGLVGRPTPQPALVGQSPRVGTSASVAVQSRNSLIRNRRSAGPTRDEPEPGRLTCVSPKSECRRFDPRP